MLAPARCFPFTCAALLSPAGIILEEAQQQALAKAAGCANQQDANDGERKGDANAECDQQEAGNKDERCASDSHREPDILKEEGIAGFGNEAKADKGPVDDTNQVSSIEGLGQRLCTAQNDNITCTPKALRSVCVYMVHLPLMSMSLPRLLIVPSTQNPAQLR